MSCRQNARGIRVCTGLTRVFHHLPALHSTERFAGDPAKHSVHWNFSEIHLVEQNSKLTLRNMAG
ncbi:hypothetical protein DIE12_19155 [Burkholderia sp. Bp9015]|nr:hypothetical protein DIE20_08875 [Burkholderia sp. Bp9131]RQR70991.1 hypothetical protein DIE12_19155 [Burkholderia sp. Bp9015]RQR80428.1 hypothetical protein DIE10_20125 [Burkholderia sp. Bp9011]RQR89883.1 hypothetical protein DIE09_21570 [Burkholderia sp. Bp9010]RQS70663.1 hypothetical protein DID97_22900 [Burkholderia sp. Bp8977]